MKRIFPFFFGTAKMGESNFPGICWHSTMTCFLIRFVNSPCVSDFCPLAIELVGIRYWEGGLFMKFIFPLVLFVV